MDQACAFGAPVAMEFNGNHLRTSPLALGGTFYLVVVDLKASKDTVRILADLQGAYPTPRDETDKGLHHLLGPLNWELTEKAMDCLQQGQAKELGVLMAEAQRYFKHYAVPLCPEQLESPSLYKLLSMPSILDHVWGGKGVGSQGDGCAQFVCKSEADMERVMEICRAEGLAPISVVLRPLQQLELE